jgi:hypothetical protein
MFVFPVGTACFSLSEHGYLGKSFKLSFNSFGAVLLFGFLPHEGASISPVCLWPVLGRSSQSSYWNLPKFSLACVSQNLCFSLVGIWVVRNPQRAGLRGKSQIFVLYL